MRHRHLLQQLVELFKKRAIEIKIAAVFAGFPFVAIPKILVHHRNLTVWAEHRDQILASLVALTAVEFLVVAPGHAALLAAVWAVRRLGKTELLVKCAVAIEYFKILLAVEAIFHASIIHHLE